MPRKAATPKAAEAAPAPRIDPEAREIIRDLLATLRSQHARFYPGTPLPGFPVVGRAEKWLEKHGAELN